MTGEGKETEGGKEEAKREAREKKLHH